MLTGYALDSSARTIDTDGRLHISRSHISKATVNPYYGSEIPGHEALGLSPNRVYQMLRCPESLAAGASTFARLPILSRHVPVSADAPRQDLIIGSIGSDVTFAEPYLDADLSFWDATAIAGIETNTVRELSCAYHYTPVMQAGTYKGQPYDGIMTNIRGNHLALVEAGRAGSDVLAADEALKTMKTTKLGKALIITIGGLSPKLAQDSLLTLVGQATKTTFNAAEVSSKLIALDAELDPKKLTATMDALLALDADKEEKPRVAEDEDEDDDPDPAQDEDEDDEDEKKKKKVAEDAKLQTAMDSFKRELREADEARRAVRPVVGDVIAQDSAAGIYGFALDHMKVAHEGVTEIPALKALFSLAQSRIAQDSTPAPRIAQDSAGLASKFPAATRFRQQ